MSLLAARDPLLPRSPDGNAPGAALSLLAHAALVAALAYGVSWRAPTPTAVSAELWAAVPQTAAPPAPEPAATPTAEPAPAPPPAPPVQQVAPPPPQPDPQIAIEKARREKAEKARLEAEERARRREELAREKAEADKREKERLARAEAERREKERQTKEREARAKAEKEKAAEEARLAKLREDNLRRMMGQVESAATGSGAPGSRGTAKADAAPSAAYAGKLTAAIKGNLIFDWRGPGNPAAVVEVRAAPSGTIMGRTLVRSSGHADWDDAILRAIDRTARLPADTDGRVPAVLTITFRPRD